MVEEVAGYGRALGLPYNARLMLDQPDDRSRALRTALIQGAVLTVLGLLAFHTQIQAVLDNAVRDKESAHLLAAPILVALLTYRRRREIVEALRGPTVWGLVVIVAAIFLYAATRWPFNYGYPHRLAMVVALAEARPQLTTEPGRHSSLASAESAGQTGLPVTQSSVPYQGRSSTATRRPQASSVRDRRGPVAVRHKPATPTMPRATSPVIFAPAAKAPSAAAASHQRSLRSSIDTLRA